VQLLPSRYYSNRATVPHHYQRCDSPNSKAARLFLVFYKRGDEIGIYQNAHRPWRRIYAAALTPQEESLILDQKSLLIAIPHEA
jgi:hypothetical protein